MHLVPHGAGCYLHSLNACLLDERIVNSDTTTVEWIASAIVHEATHARLEKLGVPYDEALRQRIERICVRRERDFAGHLSGADALQEGIMWRLHRCSEDCRPIPTKRCGRILTEEKVEIVRHMGFPERAITLALRTRALVSGIRRFTRRIAGSV